MQQLIHQVTALNLHYQEENQRLAQFLDSPLIAKALLKATNPQIVNKNQNIFYASNGLSAVKSLSKGSRIKCKERETIISTPKTNKKVEMMACTLKGGSIKWGKDSTCGKQKQKVKRTAKGKQEITSSKIERKGTIKKISSSRQLFFNSNLKKEADMNSLKTIKSSTKLIPSSGLFQNNW